MFAWRGVLAGVTVRTKGTDGSKIRRGRRRWARGSGEAPVWRRRCSLFACAGSCGELVGAGSHVSVCGVKVRLRGRVVAFPWRGVLVRPIARWWSGDNRRGPWRDGGEHVGVFQRPWGRRCSLLARGLMLRVCPGSSPHVGRVGLRRLKPRVRGCAMPTLAGAVSTADQPGASVRGWCSPGAGALARPTAGGSATARSVLADDLVHCHLETNSLASSSQTTGRLCQVRQGKTLRLTPQGRCGACRPRSESRHVWPDGVRATTVAFEADACGCAQVDSIVVPGRVEVADRCGCVHKRTPSMYTESPCMIDPHAI